MTYFVANSLVMSLVIKSAIHTFSTFSLSSQLYIPSPLFHYAHGNNMSHETNGKADSNVT